MEATRIADIAAKVGQEVLIQGWLYNRRESGAIQFLLIRDGSGLIQAVVTKENESVFNRALSLTQESSLRALGTVREDKRAPTGYELKIKELEIIHLAEEYPISLKEHGVGFLMDHRHLWIRSSKQIPVLKIRHEVMKAIRDFFDERGFIATEAPILTPTSVEGTTTLFEVNYFDDKAYLSQSGQLYLEATAMALGNVYWIGPAFRAEKSKTRKHLTEFWMAEAEMAFCDHECNLKLQEELVKFIVQRCLEKRAKELKELERDTERLEKAISGSFARITYAQALDILREKNLALNWGEDFGAPHEEALGEEKPVFVELWPASMKPFYTEPVSGNEELVFAADLIAPEGYGEIIGGSQRIFDKQKLENRLQAQNLPKAPYEWYLDLRRYGSVPHAGFGLGVERTIAWICGLEHLREAIPFPRQLHRLTP